MTATAFWKQSRETLLKQLAATENGLSSSEAAARLVKYGSNAAAAAKRTPVWLGVARRFGNPLVIILLFASGLSAITGDAASFLIIAGIVLLLVLLDFVQESRAQSAVDALQAKVALRAAVRRDGAEVSCPVDQVGARRRRQACAAAISCRPTACCCPPATSS